MKKLDGFNSDEGEPDCDSYNKNQNYEKLIINVIDQVFEEDNTINPNNLSKLSINSEGNIKIYKNRSPSL
jgi:hypothetical protein